MREKRWEMKAQASEQKTVETLMRQHHIRYLTALSLCHRGVLDADAFLHRRREYPDPFGMAGMTEAVERIRRAEDSGQRITVYGDYDMDGISATAILMRYFISRGIEADYYIPDRKEEGYGLNTGALQKIAERGTKLVITVDTGITAVNEAVYAKTLGLDMIVTDHHELQGDLPDCVCVINPKRPDDTYSEHDFCGAGVAFKLVQALTGENTPEKLRPYIELACLGTVADVVKLTGENRKIVKDGLEFLQNAEVLGLEALKEVAGVHDREVDEGTIGYNLAPRMNAVGRLHTAEDGVRLLLSNDKAEAAELARRLNHENQERQRIEAEIYQEALLQIANDPQKAEKEILILCEAYWHRGVIGIVASRLAERFSKPVILLSSDGACLKGSGRSYGSFNLFEAISSCSDLLLSFGGHQKAAGLTLSKENYSKLCERLEAYVKENITPDDLTPVVEIDAEISSRQMTKEDVLELQCLKPYGIGNTEPVFALFGAEIRQLQKIGKDQNHLRLVLQKDGGTFEAVWFRADPWTEALQTGDLVDAAFTLEMNYFRDNERVQLFIKDMRESRAKPFSAPTLETMRRVFCAVRAEARDGSYEGSLFSLRMKTQKDITARDLTVSLEILEEAGVWHLLETGKRIKLRMLLSAGEKVKPEETKQYQRLLERSKKDGKII